jgi:uncharacterized ubiquitin-like protein YukD
MINIHVISSTSYGDFDMIVSENITIKNIKEKINTPINISTNPSINQTKKVMLKKNQILYYGSHKLNDNKTLKDYEIKDGAIIFLHE